MRKWVPLVLPLVGLGIFVWIIRGIGLSNILGVLRGVDPRKLLIFPLFTIFIIWMHGLRWRLLMRMVGIDYSLWRSNVVWAIGFFGASITPAKVGDALRAYYLSRDAEREFAVCFATVVIDRLLDLVVMLVLGIVTLLLFSYYYIRLASVWIIVAAIPVLFFLIYLFFHRELMRRFLGPFFRTLVPSRYREELSLHFHSFYDAMAIYLRNWKQTSVGFTYTLLFWGAVLLMAYAIVRMLGLNITLGYLALLLPMLTLVETIPVSVAGLGTREAAAIYFFSVVGVGGTEAVAFSLLYVLLGTYMVAAVGFVAWLFKPRRLRGNFVRSTSPAE
jgi:uncharacterized protein (TIRG00374 family)